MPDDAGEVGKAARVTAEAVASRAVAFEQSVDEKIVARAIEGRLEEAYPKATADVGGLEIADALDARSVVARCEEDVGFETQALRSAEKIAVLPIAVQGRPVDGRVAGRKADDARLSFGDFDEDRQPPCGVERLGFADAHGAERLDAADGFAHVGDGFRRVGDRPAPHR